MEIKLTLSENKNPCTVGDLVRRINKNLKEQVLIEQTSGVCKHTIFHKIISYIRAPRLVFDTSKKHADISQLYSTIINAGYSIKKSKIIREDGLNKDNRILTEDYMETQAKSKITN